MQKNTWNDTQSTPPIITQLLAFTHYEQKTKQPLGGEPWRSIKGKPFFRLCIVTSGHCSILCDEQSYAFKSGQGLFVFPHSTATLSGSNSDAFSLFMIDFQANNWIEMLASLHLTPQHPSFDFLQWSQQAFLVLQDMEEESQQYPFRHFALTAGLYRLMGILSALQPPNTHTAKAKDEDILLRIVIEKMSRDLSVNQSIDQIAREIQISRTKLYRLCRKQFGKSPIQILTQLRMKKIINLLEETNLSIFEIAKVTGFPKSTYMIQVFKKHMGITPSRYRLRHSSTQTFE